MRDFSNSRLWSWSAILGFTWCSITSVSPADAAGKRPGRAPSNQSSASTPHEELVPPLKIAYDVQKRLAEINDYEARFSKNVRIGARMVSQTMDIKVRENPFSVYLRFHSPNPGREVLYVHGQNSNQLLAHEAGLKAIAGTITLLPTSKLAMDGCRYPITQIGMSKMLQTIISQWENTDPTLNVEVQYYPNAKFESRACRVIETKVIDKKPGVKFHMTRLYIDKETQLPIRVEQYDFPKRAGRDLDPQLEEEFSYSLIRTNVGLKDHDFSPQNRQYGF